MSIEIDNEYENYEDARFYDVSLCFTFMEMDDCITFEMVSDGEIEDKVGLIESLIENYNGVAEMDDGTIINLNRYVNAFVTEAADRKDSLVRSKFEIVH